MEFKIIHQGYMDGCCLLYAMMNGLKALLDPDKHVDTFYSKRGIESKWRTLVSMVPSVHNYLNGHGSGHLVSSYPLDVTISANLIENAFQAFKGSKYKFQVDQLDFDDFSSKYDYSDSVVLIVKRRGAETECLDGNNHWLCVVGRSESELLFACSYSIYGTCVYSERTDEATGRIYNNTFETKRIRKSNIDRLQIFEIKLITNF